MRSVPEVTPRCSWVSSATHPLKPKAYSGEWHVEKWNDKAA